tara:strand:+ start:131 stop:1714 length:1584 start_codon:yes stop_codon:yes gene_type:complete
MPIQRNQPSPERQSVLSFVSPSVADLLFFETVDAKTVGAGTGVSISSATWAATNLVTGNTPDDSVEGGVHSNGYTVTVNTSTNHQFLTDDVVTIEGLGSKEDDSGYFRPSGTHKITKVDANTFTFFVREQPDASSPLDVSNNARVYIAHPSYGTVHPDTENFPRHKLCYVKQADGEGLYYQYYYAADRLHQDDYNFEYSQADLGGNKYNSVIRTYVILRSDFTEADAKYDAGDRMPDIPNSKFPDDTYILMTRKQKRIGDRELDGLFVVEQRVYFHRADIITHTMDSATGGVLARVEKVVYRGEQFNPPNATAALIETIAEQDDDDKWGLDDDGRSWACEQVSYDWWKITIQDVIPQGLGSLYGGKLIRQYDTWQNFTWPSVVDGLVFTSADRKDGASQTTVTVRMKEGKQGGNWPTKMTVKQVWSKSVFSSGSLPTPTVFKTTSARYAGIQFKVSVTNVLTPAITLTDFIGTKHPTYKLGEYAFPKPWCQASDPTDWPESEFEAAVTQKPFRGGYLLEVVFVHPPS